ncbi:hypothetical protein AURDEDRAFT_117439 [Auricularia subglabra TFB-10046 SS5]|uniref:Uncharacterized protein n=1 Tax=Auricularia subglabra (strain TFB-10046 / SS5) TaxID=717982 RepID=J0WSP6_AURST|nr:hypothetical protein AURDEDRAFT_117439 [Auricularia subglabra TFB-10046 SS5]
MTPLYALLTILALGGALADTIPGSSPAWGLVTGDRKLAPLDDCISVTQGEALYLVQPDVAQLVFQGTSVTVKGGGGIGTLTLDDAQSITTKDTGGDECTQLVQWTGLDGSKTHILRVEALEEKRAIAIALVQIDGQALTTPPPPSSTTEPPKGSSSTPPTVCTTNEPPPSTPPGGAGSSSSTPGGASSSSSNPLSPNPSPNPSAGTPPNDAMGSHLVPSAAVLLASLLSALWF